MAFAKKLNNRDPVDVHRPTPPRHCQQPRIPDWVSHARRPRWPPRLLSFPLHRQIFYSTVVNDHAGGLRVHIPWHTTTLMARIFWLQFRALLWKNWIVLSKHSIVCIYLHHGRFSFSDLGGVHKHSWIYCVALFFQSLSGLFSPLLRPFSLNQTMCVTFTFFKKSFHIVNSTEDSLDSERLYPYFLCKVNSMAQLRWCGQTEQMERAIQLQRKSYPI